ncbi:hypothetical protein FSP39_011709 [Pinctada imbricata]|uniref:Uncharacterized protein n=1 Tax=Pinctada imbricata TaxID=66713 RepID=A0AA88XRQ1_PINIB|nr:hypothetical protein FSP39_011709 [Pinctada imbricata]
MSKQASKTYKRKQPESTSPIENPRSLRRRHHSITMSSPALNPVPEGLPLHPQNTDMSQMLVGQLSNPLIVNAIVPILSAALTPLINQTIQSAVHSAIAPLSTKVAQQEQQIAVLQSTNAELVERVADLENDVEELEQYGRRTSLRFHNVAVPSDSNSDNVIVDLVNKKLGVKITHDDINRSHPVGKPNQSGRRQLICRFRNWKLKNEIFMKKKHLKTDPDRIFITEDLTRYRQSIVSNISRAKKSRHVHSFWTNDGRIFLKLSESGEKHLVRSVADLERLVPMLAREAADAAS